VFNESVCDKQIQPAVAAAADISSAVTDDDSLTLGVQAAVATPREVYTL